MEITQTKIFDMATTIMAGAMANPGNAVFITDTYGKIQMFVDIVNSLEQAMLQKNVQIDYT